MNDKTLQIPADVGACCRDAAKVLKSSHRFLIRELEVWQDEDPAPDFEWTVNIDYTEVERLRDNLSKAAEMFDWLAKHGEHSQPVERISDEGDAVQI